MYVKTPQARNGLRGRREVRALVFGLRGEALKVSLATLSTNAPEHGSGHHCAHNSADDCAGSARAIEAAGAVSYTHLTLPTIYSV